MGAALAFALVPSPVRQAHWLRALLAMARSLAPSVVAQQAWPLLFSSSHWCENLDCWGVCCFMERCGVRLADGV